MHVSCLLSAGDSTLFFNNGAMLILSTRIIPSYCFSDLSSSLILVNDRSLVMRRAALNLFTNDGLQGVSERLSSATKRDRLQPNTTLRPLCIVVGRLLGCIHLLTSIEPLVQRLS